MIIWPSASIRPVILEPVADVYKGDRFVRYLASYAESQTRNKMIKPDQFIFFLDSGAYSAWTKGTEIDLDEYIAFIKTNIENIEVYACLDSIPGKPGQQPSEAERARAAQRTWDNYLYMKAHGLDPLPVYHYGEDFSNLDRMIDYGCDYIGVGGLVAVPGAMRRNWLDRLFKKITDVNGMPTVKTHGFGMTSIPLIFRYPWYSVDSTSWIQATANGKVFLPAMHDNQFVYDELPAGISVSHQQATTGKGANTMSGLFRKVLDRWLAECGVTYDQVCEHYYYRAIVNVTFFKRVSEAKAVHPFNPDGIRRQSIWEDEM